MANILIAFFSRADENYVGGAIKRIDVGNTEIVANKILKYIKADLFRIEMKIPYAKDYDTCVEEAKKHKRDSARPELVSLPHNIAEYDKVILAYPNYWETMPMAVFTFLDKLNLSGKTIFPVCTNEGSDMGNSENDIKDLCERSKVEKGLSIIGSRAESSDEQIKKWLKENNLI